MPAGSLTVHLDRAKDLAFPETHKPLPGEVVRMDPYVSLNLEGKAVKMIKRTPADKDGGACIFDCAFVYLWLVYVAALCARLRYVVLVHGTDINASIVIVIAIATSLPVM